MIAMKALSRQKTVNKKLEGLPASLAGELFETLNPLLLCPKSPAVDREASKARSKMLADNHGRRVEEIYKHAIALRKGVCLKDFGYSFYWINAGEYFNNEIMDAEIYSQRIEFYAPPGQEKLKVVATTLPGICRSESRMECAMKCANLPEEKNIIVRALTYLGASVRG